jgi:hypothetical protein
MLNKNFPKILHLSDTLATKRCYAALVATFGAVGLEG